MFLVRLRIIVVWYLQCQIRKKSTAKPIPLHPLPLVTLPNQRVHIDLFGPLKTSEKANKYILCMTDAFTKYAEVVAIPDKTALSMSNEIFIHWICRFGTPIQIHSDGGKEFCNKLADELYNCLTLNTQKLHQRILNAMPKLKFLTKLLQNTLLHSVTIPH